MIHCDHTLVTTKKYFVLYLHFFHSISFVFIALFAPIYMLIIWSQSHYHHHHPVSPNKL